MKCSNTAMMSMSIFCFIFCSASASPQNFDSIKGKAKGVSFHHLKTTFAEEVRNYRINHGNDSDNDDILQKTTIRDLENTRKEKNGLIRLKGADVTCPRDDRVGAAYVDCIQGEDNVGEANVMISYSWNNTVREIIDVLEQFTLKRKLDPKRTYVWICCLCNNQHRVFESNKKGESVPFEEFQETFETQVTSIDSIVSLMSPWQEPKNLERVWCIFEMHTAQKNNCDITIEMPRKEREDFKKTILKERNSIEEMFKTLSNIHIDKANTTVPEDKKKILKVVKDGVGVDSLNVSVAEMMRTWFFTQLNEFLDELDVNVEKENYGGKDPLELTDGYHSLGYIFYMNGDYETAKDCYTKQVKLCEKCFGEDHHNTAASYNGIAMVYNELGQYEEAIQYHKKNIAIKEKVHGLDHEYTATAYLNIGGVYYKKEELDTALQYLEKSCRIWEDVYGKVHERTARAYNDIGLIHYKKGDYDLAMKYFKDSLKIRKKTIGADHPSTASSYSNIGGIHKDKGDWDKALEFFFLALHIQEKALGEEHLETIVTYTRIGAAYIEKGDVANARKYRKKAKLLEE